MGAERDSLIAVREWAGEKALCYTKLSKGGNRGEGLMVVGYQPPCRGKISLLEEKHIPQKQSRGQSAAEMDQLVKYFLYVLGFYYCKQTT